MEENIIKGEKIERKIFWNVGELTYNLLINFKNTVLQIDAATNQELTGSILLKRAVRLATFFKKYGIGLGDTVAIMSENRLEYCTVPVASFFVGATIAPLNPDYTVGELNHILNFSKPKLIFATPSAASKLKQVKEKLDCVKHIILFDSNEENDIFLSFNNIIKGSEDENAISTFSVEKYNPKETVAAIFCSSGTTGTPKGVMITHDNITSCIEIWSHNISRMKIDKNEDPRDVIIGITPFCHSFGFITMYFYILRGKLMIVSQKFSPTIFLDTIVKYRIRTIVAPPTLLVFLIKNPIVKQYDLSCVKEVIAGASPLGKETEIELRERFKFRHAGQSYGMTETTWGVISSPHQETKLGSVGRILPGMMAKIIDDKGNALGPYENGELCLKGPMIMKGYIGNEATTLNCIDEDRWLHTGDVAYYDNDKYFFIVDRTKELIKYKGFQVAPSELEDLLLSHPAVNDAAVIGLPDEYSGELPLAFVVKKPGKDVSSDELKRLISENLSSQKQLRGGVIFIDEIPRNHVGKTLRRVLKIEAVKRLLKHKF
ncbi:hypothetical protein WA026_011655 [Henosepilachna vigintioctopunctata]|uniref:Luciferin 4-monooxygenase n=1 Tax=Henosepilachna vigintioctopunctata TaxID=420089 RepID=A0AAW1TSU9_9CUCU